MEYGGYIPLELENRGEFFECYSNAKIARFNCGRNAIAALALSIRPQTIWIPYYNCVTVRETLQKYEIPIKLYYLDDNLEPLIQGIDENEWVLYPNYFGIASDEKIGSIVSKYEYVILDNTQAFFATPIFAPNCFNIYSPRKFVGVADGAYIVWDNDYIINQDYPVDISWNRAAFLLKSIELGTNAAYRENLESMIPFDYGIRQMSVLTRKMLCSFDYRRNEKIRIENYKKLHEKLSQVNWFNLPVDVKGPFIYPLFIKSITLRRALVDRKIYVPQWWKYLLDEVPADSVEAKLSNYLFPLPLDQRYSVRDMDRLANIVIECLFEI